MKTFDDIATEVLKIPREDLRDDLSSTDVPDWDSMNYLLFISALEKEFKFSFSMSEVLGATTLGDLRAIVLARGKQ